MLSLEIPFILKSGITILRSLKIVAWQKMFLKALRSSFRAGYHLQAEAGILNRYKAW